MSILPSDPAAAHRSGGRGGFAVGIAITLILGAGAGVLFQRLGEASAATVVVAGPQVVGTPRADTWLVRPTPARADRAARAPAPKHLRACGTGEQIVRFRVTVDKGLATTKGRFAQHVLRILCDERSWTAGGRIRFVYDSNARTVIALRSAAMTERRCLQLIGLSVRFTYSCASRGDAEAVINADRWFGGSKTWPGSVAMYRHMVINHEVGHLLGLHHRGCRRAGRRAPVMMQQSKGVDGCKPNPWPLRSELRAVR